MTVQKAIHRGGRQPLNDPIRTFSVNPRSSEYAAIKEAAAAQGKTLSRFLVDAALKEAAAMKAAGDNQVSSI